MTLLLQSVVSDDHYLRDIVIGPELGYLPAVSRVQAPIVGAANVAVE